MRLFYDFTILEIKSKGIWNLAFFLLFDLICWSVSGIPGSVVFTGICCTVVDTILYFQFAATSFSSSLNITYFMMKQVQLLHTLSRNTWKGGIAPLFYFFEFPCLPCLILCSIKRRALIPIKSVWTRKSYENKYREGRQSCSGLGCYKLPSVVAGPCNFEFYFWKT